MSISQPAATGMLNDLERLLGLVLFTRIRIGMSLGRFQHHSQKLPRRFETATLSKRGNYRRLGNSQLALTLGSRVVVGRPLLIAEPQRRLRQRELLRSQGVGMPDLQGMIF